MDARGVLSGRIPGRKPYGPGERPLVLIRTTDLRAAQIARDAQLAADSVGHGDILSAAADAIVSAANGIGLMNGGVDLRIRDHFGDGRLEERVRETIVERHGGQLAIGQTVAIRTRPPGTPMPAGDAEWLIVSPTMTQPRAMGVRELKDATFVATLAALVKARDIAARVVALTTMGAGVGAGAHTDRGADATRIAAAIDAMDQALVDFLDIAHDRTTYDQALAEYRAQASDAS
jgi:O-acetyl-ADP-ribose deacetylase (regulator of RNase III)